MKKLILVLMLFSRTVVAQTYDTTASSSGSSGAGLTPITFALTVGSNTNRVLFLGCHTAATATNATITATDYNGDPMTPITGAGDVGDSTADSSRIQTFKLAAPDTGTHDVSVVWDQNDNGNWECIAVSIYAADQTTMNRTPSSRTGGTTAETSSTLSPTSVSGDLVIDFIGWRYTGQGTVTTGASQSDNVRVLSVRGASSRETAGGATTTMDWSWATAGWTSSSQVAFAVMPVSATAKYNPARRRR